MATTANNQFADLPVPSDELLDAIMVDLGLSGSRDAEEFKAKLVWHARSFAIGRMIEAASPNTHESRDHAASAGKSLAKALQHIDALNPLVSALVAADFEGNGDRPFMKIIGELERLQQILSRVGKARPSKKQPDRALRNAIGGLMLERELKTGRRAKVSPRRSHSGSEPSLSSPEARAIASLLRISEPKLADTTIVNQIISIRRKHRGGRQLTEFAGQILLGTSVY